MINLVQFPGHLWQLGYLHNTGVGHVQAPDILSGNEHTDVAASRHCSADSSTEAMGSHWDTTY